MFRLASWLIARLGETIHEITRNITNFFRADSGDFVDRLLVRLENMTLQLRKPGWNASYRTERGLWNFDVVVLIVATTSEAVL